jgi:predicted transcriptional regulator
MSTYIPSATHLRERMEHMNWSDLEALAKRSGVPFHTLRKLASGETVNPRLETVRQLWPELLKSTTIAA